MPTIDHNHQRGDCETCRALKVWREKCRGLKRRLEIAEKAALACPKPLVWTSDKRTLARPFADWHEDIGPVLWWAFPIEEPPYVGTPLDAWFVDGKYTHWTYIPEPVEPKE